MNRKLILLMTSLSLTVALPFQTAVYASESATIVPVENRASLQAATGEYRSWKGIQDGAVCIWVPVPIRWQSLDVW